MLPADDDSIGSHLGLEDFNFCQARLCESPFTNPPVRAFPHTPWVPNPRLFEPAGHVHPLCGRDATMQPLVATPKKHHGWLSMCNLRHNEPANGTHPRPNPDSPLVCRPCKRLRGTDRVRRQKELWFGVCDPCANFFRTEWAATRRGVNQMYAIYTCKCPPTGLQVRRPAAKCV